MFDDTDHDFVSEPAIYADDIVLAQDFEGSSTEPSVREQYEDAITNELRTEGLYKGLILDLAPHDYSDPNFNKTDEYQRHKEQMQEWRQNFRQELPGRINEKMNEFDQLPPHKQQEELNRSLKGGADALERLENFMNIGREPELMVKAQTPGLMT